MSQSEALHCCSLYTPYTNATTLSPWSVLCGERSTLYSHVTRPRPARSIYIPGTCIPGTLVYKTPWTQTTVRLPHPSSRSAQFLVRHRNFVPLCARAFSRMVEASRLATGAGARRRTLAQAHPPWRKKHSLVTLRRSEWSPWFV